MSDSDEVKENGATESPEALVDQYDNRHYREAKLAEGGQGVVYRTADTSLALKQPKTATGELDKDINLYDRFQEIRLLPLPPRIQISLPLAILRDEPGYVMQLFNGMEPFSHFSLSGKTKIELGKQTLPPWLEKARNKDTALLLLHYAQTGSTSRRLFMLAKCASILARIHCAGLVYGDISTENVFFGNGNEVSLIDTDNLRSEYINSGRTYMTPGYGSPEIVRGLDHARPRTDCWAFAVLAYKTITLCHPFIGKKVMKPDSDDGGWDAEPAADGTPADLDEQAYGGYLPFVEDKNDNSNARTSGLSGELVATPEVNLLFQETFGAGRTQPHRRPSMAFWAMELTRAYDKSLYCPNCGMSYFADKHTRCPYCKTSRPSFLLVRTQHWEIIISADTKEFALPHRLFNPFSFEHNDDMEYNAVINFAGKTVKHARGTKRLPENMSYKFVEAVS